MFCTAMTHLFGNPCDLDPILALAAERDVPVVEDAAQAYLATYRGKTVGTLTQIAAFSLQQTKQMTCGEGGFVLTSDEGLARRARLWADKGWSYGDSSPDHEFLGLNYRMTELQGAVALAQRNTANENADRAEAEAATAAEAKKTGWRDTQRGLAATDTRHL